MTLAVDKSAFLDAFEAYWSAEGGTQGGLEAFLETYLERTGLTSAHDAAVTAHDAFRDRFAGIRASVLEAAE